MSHFVLCIYLVTCLYKMYNSINITIPSISNHLIYSNSHFHFTFLDVVSSCAVCFSIVNELSSTFLFKSLKSAVSCSLSRSLSCSCDTSFSTFSIAMSFGILCKHYASNQHLRCFRFTSSFVRVNY